jgi:hypothetical protein
MIRWEIRKILEMVGVPGRIRTANLLISNPFFEIQLTSLISYFEKGYYNDIRRSHPFPFMASYSPSGGSLKDERAILPLHRYSQPDGRPYGRRYRA